MAIAAAVGAAAMLLRQPLIVAFIAVGIIVGPSWLDLISAEEALELLATLGISLLLFLVGLRLDLNVIRTTGPVALVTGVGQIVFTSVIGFLIALALGLSLTPAFYVAIALTFSSTIIIVKLLSDKREIDALHGRIAVGFLIVQDIAVVIAMIAISAVGARDETDPLFDAIFVLVKGVGLLVGVGLLMRFVIPHVLHLLARSQELMILSCIAWAVGLAAFSDYLGFSTEVGAFLAGVTIASTPYRELIGSRLVSVRDFLLLFFFLALGGDIELSEIGGQVAPAIVLSAFVLIGNPIIVMVIMGVMGYRKRTGFLAGLTVAQISEFSLILAALGLSFGHINGDTLGLITLVGLITIGLSTYLILYSHPIYDRIARFLDVFERDVPHREEEGESGAPPASDVVLFGLGRYGSNLARDLRERGLSVLGVDFDPQVVAAWRAQDLPVRYGDGEDPEFIGTLPLDRTQWVVGTMPQVSTNVVLLRALRHHGYRGKVALTAHHEWDAARLREAGADEVLLPFVGASLHSADVIAGAASGTEGIG